ncbi:MAG: hypothetical protein NTV34_16965 [Proteobacteria bacterium]|nr:hypothetical protein [Pseudomonadota bacterium]
MSREDPLGADGKATVLGWTTRWRYNRSPCGADRELVNVGPLWLTLQNSTLYKNQSNYFELGILSRRV